MKIGDKVRLIREVPNVVRGYTPKGSVVTMISPFEDGSCLATNNVGSVLRIYSKDFELIDWYEEDKYDELERSKQNILNTLDRFQMQVNNMIDKYKTKFNWKLILQPHTVIHCDTEEKAIALLAEADSRGLKWADYLSFTSKTRWSIYKNNTCYMLTDGTLDGLDFFKDRNYTILTYEDVLLKGDQTMKRIDIRKSCSNDEYELEVMNYRDDNPIFFGIRNKNYRDYDVTVRISKYHLSLTQANTILAPFGYELY